MPNLFKTEIKNFHKNVKNIKVFYSLFYREITLK